MVVFWGINGVLIFLKEIKKLETKSRNTHLSLCNNGSETKNGHDYVQVS